MKAKTVGIILGVLFLFLIWKAPDSAAAVARGIGGFITAVGNFFVSLISGGNAQPQ